MHKSTQQPKTCTVESPSVQSVHISREKHILSHRRVRISHSNRKVPASYFPLFENEAAKIPRKTASRVHRVESTCFSKKSNKWKMQRAQNTGRNAYFGHACLENSHSLCNHPLGNCGPTAATRTETASQRPSISTTCGDIQRKKCALDFGPSGNSMENAPPLSSRVHPFIIAFRITSAAQSPPMTFHIENVFGSPFLANNDFDNRT